MENNGNIHFFFLFSFEIVNDFDLEHLILFFFYAKYGISYIFKIYFPILFGMH